MRKIGIIFQVAKTALLLVTISQPALLAQDGGINGGPERPLSPPLVSSPADPAPPQTVSEGQPVVNAGQPAGPIPTQSESSTENLLRTLTGGNPDRLSVPLRILALLTVLTLVPSIILLTTCFPRIVIVLSFVRRAIGTQELPPNQVIIGLSLFLTAVIMAPIWEKIHQGAIVPYQAHEIGEEEAFRRALHPLKKFMLDRTLRSDLRLFLEISKYREKEAEKGRSVEEQPLINLPITVIVPSFIMSELKTAFQMGFVLYLPFVIIDLIIGTALISMGMLVLPPILISLPLKVLVFVLVDGWHLIVQELVRSFV